MGGDYAMNNFSCLTKKVKEKYINLSIGQNSSCDILPFISCIINGQGSTVSLKLKFLANFDGTFLLLMLTFIQVVGKLSHLHWAKSMYKGVFRPCRHVQQRNKHFVIHLYFIGNKTKGRISKRRLKENKERQNVPKTITCAYHVCVSEGKKCLSFGKYCILFIPITSILRFALLLYYRPFDRH